MKTTLPLLSCLLLLPIPLNSAELAKDGATAWKIVLPAEPTPVEKTAARELAEHLQLVTGAEFPTISEQDASADGTSLMFVGNTGQAPKKDYKFDEILIRLDGGNLIFAGHPQRGCLYAVYSFLQDVVGVRWWTPADTFLPRKPTLTVADDLSVSYAPQLISREMYHRDAQPTVFSARLKGNGFLTPDYGGAVRIINFVHSFYKYLPPEKYFADHPDWYSEIDGKRRHEHAQLCLTNDAMTQELIKNILETLRKNPDAKIIDVSQNDWHGFCTCEKCKAVDDAEESHAGTLLVMLNKVAEAVEKEFPDVLVETLAYQYTRQPPKTIRPRDNVLIRLCTIECSYIQPLDGEQNRKFAADMEGWSKLAKHLFVWDYTTNYNDYLGPHPNLRVLVPNVRYFVRHGAIGLFAEGEGDDFCELKNWLLLRVMWEPHLDGEPLIDEFLRGYYGEAVAPLIKQYWDLLIAQAEKERIYLGCFGMNSAKWLDLATLNQVTEIMNRAVETAANVYGPESDELRRLRKSKMGIDHVWLSRYYPLRCEAREQKQPFLGPQDPLQAAVEFAQLCRRFKTKAAVISQEANFGQYLEGLKAGFLAQQNPPDICRDVPEDAWVVFDALSFNNFNNAATIVDDPQGWNGKSVRMGTKVDWNTSYTPPVRGKYRLLASLRCEGQLQEGRLGSWGVYDSQAKKSLRSMTLHHKDFATEDGSFDRKFRWIDLGVVDFVPGAYFWFAHGHSPELDAIYVDRVVLISSSPVNDGSKLDDWKGDRCRKIHPYTVALGTLAQAEKVVFVDQYHPLLDLWAGNKLPDGKERVPLGGDPVHPGAVGQLTMAATILAALGADPEVSSATLTASGTVVEEKLCGISNVTAKDGGLSFTRLDQRGPWPIAPPCREALKLMPQIADLSRYLLKVTDLADGEYTVSLNGQAVARLTAKELAGGWNMSTLAEGVVAQRSAKIVELVSKLQGPLNTAWRAASKAGESEKLAECQQAIDACEAELAAACKPVALQFEIRPADK